MMVEKTIDTIQIQAYTPAGFRVYVTVGFTSADEIDKLLQDNGFLVNVVGAEPGEEVETITHISVRNKTNDDGTVTPHIAFYIDNEALEWRWAHVYLNSESDIAEFEKVTGLKIDNLPVYPADNHPPRKADKMSYIIALPRPIKVARKQVEKSDGTTRNLFQRYVTGSASTTPDNVTTLSHWSQDKGKLAYAKQEFAKLEKQYGEQAVAVKNTLKAPHYDTAQDYIDAIKQTLGSLSSTGTENEIPF